jgi:hypothetical protein
MVGVHRHSVFLVPAARRSYGRCSVPFCGSPPGTLPILHRMLTECFLFLPLGGAVVSVQRHFAEVHPEPSGLHAGEFKSLSLI